MLRSPATPCSYLQWITQIFHSNHLSPISLLDSDLQFQQAFLGSLQTTPVREKKKANCKSPPLSLPLQIQSCRFIFSSVADYLLQAPLPLCSNPQWIIQTDLLLQPSLTPLSLLCQTQTPAGIPWESTSHRAREEGRITADLHLSFLFSKLHSSISSFIAKDPLQPPLPPCIIPCESHRYSHPIFLPPSTALSKPPTPAGIPWGLSSQDGQRNK